VSQHQCDHLHRLHKGTGSREMHERATTESTAATRTHLAQTHLVCAQAQAWTHERHSGATNKGRARIPARIPPRSCCGLRSGLCRVSLPPHWFSQKRVPAGTRQQG
jgi:hypothetical protein